jgi:nicotinamidase-related amidase
MSKEQHIVVVDMQSKFLTDKKPEDLAQKTRVICDILTQCENLSIPVTYTMFPEERFGAIIDEIKPYDLSHIVVKTDSDAFLCPEFKAKVRSSHILYFVGCNLDVCVLLTAQSAVRYGHKAVLFRDGLLTNDSSKLLELRTYNSLRFQRSLTVTTYENKKMIL